MLLQETAQLMLILLLCITGIFTIWEVKYLSKSNRESKKCGCKKCLTDYHDWFMQYYQKNIPPFLSSSYNLSQEDFHWWKGLQHERRDLTYFREVQNKLFEFYPGRPPVAKVDPGRCRTCAVVGNSGNLKSSHYGKLIDLHQFVFRINRGRIKGFEEDVGSRTTHRSMYPESAMNLDNSTHLVAFPFKMGDLNWLLRATTGLDPTKWAHEVLIKRPILTNKNLVLIINPVFMKYVHQAWLQRKGRYPSTGFMTVILALHMCDEVSVFGFGADSDGNWSHYWEALHFKHLRTGPHPGSIEYDMIVELSKRGKLTFFTGR